MTEERFTDDEFAKQVTALNTPTLIITRGAQGCSVYTDEHKHVSRRDIPGVPIARSVDATGCGDVFGAAYCAKYLTTHNVLQAAEFANTVAACNASIAGSTQIDQLSKFKIAPEPIRPEVVS